MKEKPLNRDARRPAPFRNLSMSRRCLLRGAGVAMSLPFLKAMTPACTKTARGSTSEENGKPRRMLAICNNLGVLPTHFFPNDDGFDYTLSHYLSFL